MTFYLKALSNKEPIEIGTESFDNFWCSDGWYSLNKIINNNENLEQFEVINEKGFKQTIEDFIIYLVDKQLNMIE